MSPARILGALAGLGCGALFYAVYRCDQTLSNRVLSAVCGERYAQLRDTLRHWLALPPVVRGCLPSALWCFVGSCLCGGWHVRVGSRRELGLVWLFPTINAAWEGVQALGWTDGRADVADALAGMVGGTLARVIFRARMAHDHVAFFPWSWRLGVLLAGISTMGLADVWR